MSLTEWIFAIGFLLMAGVAEAYRSEARRHKEWIDEFIRDPAETLQELIKAQEKS